jgi:hypothetical protein
MAVSNFKIFNCAAREPDTQPSDVLDAEVVRSIRTPAIPGLKPASCTYPIVTTWLDPSARARIGIANTYTAYWAGHLNEPDGDELRADASCAARARG